MSSTLYPQHEYPKLCVQARDLQELYYVDTQAAVLTTMTALPNILATVADTLATLSGRIFKVVTLHAEDCKVERSNHGCG